MGSYEIRKNTPSCDVSIELLKELERYIKTISSEISEESSELKTKIVLEDKYGEEILDTLENYSRTKIPNNVQRISINAYSYKPKFSITISLSKDIHYSYIQIEMTGDSPKERTIGILNTVTAHLKEHSNLNFIFYGKHNYIIPSIIGVSIGMSVNTITAKDITTFDIIGVSILSLGLIYGLLRAVNPYSVLDTQKNDNIKIATKWVINGLAGVFVFGVIAHYLRNGVFGF